MTIQVKYTDKIDVNKGVKGVVFGPSNVGKTRLATTAEKPFIISSENGLLSLRKERIPYAEVNNAKEVEDIHKWVVSSNEAKQFWTIIVDSGTDVAEVTLSDKKKQKADGRQAHGDTSDIIDNMFRDFRDMYGKHVIIIAKQMTTEVTVGFTKFQKAYPIMPNSHLQVGLPYMFDLVLHMHIFRHTDGKDYQAFHTRDDNEWFAKDRSGNLDPLEPANLTHVIRKAMK